MKTIDEIYQEMLELFRRETGAGATGVGDLEVRLYAVAAQVYGLYVQGEWLSRQCFPQTAEGTYLDRHAALRGLERRPARRAEGSLRFYVDQPAASDLTIPAGTVCTTAGLVRFETTAAAVLTAGQTRVDVPARAVEPGGAGNVGPGTVLAMTVAPVGIGGCSNPAAFSGGADGEDDRALRARVLETYRRMPNGANAAFYEQTALSFDRVAAAAVIPRPRGRGSVDVVVATDAGVPDRELLDQLQAHFQACREIAVDVEVRAPVAFPMVVSLQVTPERPGEEEAVKARVEQVIRDHFGGKRLSRGVLRAELIHLVLGVPGAANCKVVSPPDDLPPRPGVLPDLLELSVQVVS